MYNKQWHCSFANRNSSSTVIVVAQMIMSEDNMRKHALLVMHQKTHIALHTNCSN